MTRIACVQLSLVADEASNLKKCLGLIDRAAAEKPELIVLPEMSNWSGGLVRTRAEALEHGTPVPGRFLDALAERAERHRCFVAAGVIERLGDESYITSALHRGYRPWFTFSQGHAFEHRSHRRFSP